MTTKELLDQIYDMEAANPFTRDTYVSIHFDTNYTGSFHKCIMKGGYFVLDGSFDPDADQFYAGLDILIGMLESAPDVEVAYYVPSMGLYVAESAKRRIGDWGDGDGEYDMIAIQFTEEPVQVRESTNRKTKKSTIESKVMRGIKRGKLRETRRASSTLPSNQFTDPDYAEYMADMANLEMDAGEFDD